MVSTLRLSANDTYLSITEDTVQDMFGNKVEDIDDTQAMQVASYQPDITAPVLLSFDLDMNSGVVTLYFNEVVNAESLNVLTITVHNSTVPTDSFHKLTEGSNSEVNSTEIEVYLDITDLNAIKLDRNLATSNTSTALSITMSTVRDMALVPNYPSATILGVNNFTADITEPMLSFWSVDVNTGIISLVFDETVESDSLNITAITLQSEDNVTNTTELYTLTSASSPSSDGVMIEVVINNTDLNVIKQMLELLRDNNSSYLSFTTYLIQDMNGNYAQEVLQSDGISVMKYTNDSTRPRLVDYFLDMNTGFMRFNFSETVDASTFNFSGVTIQEAFNSTPAHIPLYTLTSGSVLSDDGPFLEVILSRQDLNELKRLEIAYEPWRTYLTMESTAVMDIEGHSVIPFDNAVDARRIKDENYVRDTTGPILENFDLDMSNETLTLYFDETVRASSLNVTQITLHSDNTMNGSIYALTNSSSVVGPQNNYHTLIIDLGENDLNNIKRFTSLATSENSTFLSHTSQLVVDMKYNDAQFISPENVTAVRNYTEDLVRPVLRRFDIDLSNDTLTLWFSETVNVSSFNASLITILESVTGVGQSIN